jgi:hypothetical protein
MVLGRFIIVENYLSGFMQAQNFINFKWDAELIAVPATRN